MKSSAEILSKIGNQLRIHSIKATTAAASGHPTSCMSSADLVAALFFHEMKYFPKDPMHPNNDRFVLSKGHSAPLLYAAWAEAGLFPVEDLINLRKLDSDLEGHPTPRLPFVDSATGSLGQGLSTGLGMALAAKLDNLPYRTYVLMGDGEIAEGSVWEAASMASLRKMDNLVGIVDVNRLGQSQPTMFEHAMDVYKARFESFGWNSLVIDGHNLQEILEAFEMARKMKGKPTMILAKTFKGQGVSFLADKDSWHGKALNAQEMEKALGELSPNAMSAGEIEIQTPENKKPNFKREGNFDDLKYNLGETIATREAYGNALVRLGKLDQRMVALDGDTKNSTFSIKFLEAYPERFFECFIAEQNMVGVGVGFAACGKVPCVSTFAAFLSRAFDQIRMSGVSEVHMILAGSHAGVSIGEDGVSQMALEDLAMMRAVYGSMVIYPCDAVSTEALLEQLIDMKGVCYMRTSRPKTPVIYKNDEEFSIGGSKVLRQSDNDKITVVGAGITVFEALKAYEQLQKDGINIRVIDAYSIKPFDSKGILQSARKTFDKVITVEDHYMQGGLGDAVAGVLSPEGIRVYKMGIQELPHSGKPEELVEKYGISSKSIVELVKTLVK